MPKLTPLEKKHNNSSESHNRPIENIINKKFDELEKKFNDLETKFENIQKITNHIQIPNDLYLKLKNSEIQIDKILLIYEELSKNELSFEEKYLFASYLINIFEQANNILKNKLEIEYKYAMEHNLYYSTDICDTFRVNKEKVIYSIELLRSSNIHDKVIGIDSFLSLSHTTNILLPELISILNGVTIIHEDIEDETQDYYFKWREEVGNKTIKKLNEIRNKKGLERFKYENM